jgi:hypothetical protein
MENQRRSRLQSGPVYRDQIELGQNDVLILAVTIAIDLMATTREGRGQEARVGCCFIPIF